MSWGCAAGLRASQRCDIECHIRPFLLQIEVEVRVGVCESLVIVKAVDKSLPLTQVSRGGGDVTCQCVCCFPRWLVSLWAGASSEVIPAQSQSKPQWINIQLILISSDKLADGSPVFYFCPLSSFTFLFLFFYLWIDLTFISLPLSSPPS